MIKRYTVTITTASDGSGTGRTDEVVYGEVAAIVMVPDGTSPYDTGVDAVVTGNSTGTPIITITNAGTSLAAYYPTAAAVDTSNAARLYAAGGQGIPVPIPISNEQIKIVLASGGSTKVGTWHVLVRE